MELQQLETSKQPETTIESQISPASGECSHLDALIADFEDIEQQETTQQMVVSGVLMDKAGFRTVFFGGAEFAKNFKPEYQSLKMLNEGNPQAVAAIDCLYDSIMDVPQLHWLLNPGGKWAQRGFAIGMFFIPFGFALYKDIKSEKQTAHPQSKTPEKKEHLVVDLGDFK